MSALAGARIINTRARAQAAELDAALKARGAESVAFPCIDIAPPNDLGHLRAAIDRLRGGEYEWLIFTSANAVSAFAAVVGPLSSLDRMRIGAVGPSTAAAIEAEFGRPPDVVPVQHDASGLLSSLPCMQNARVLAPSSSIARTELADGLLASGAAVDVVSAYQTVVGSGGADVVPMIADGEIDAVAFASPSAIDGYVTRIESSNLPMRRALALPVGCIGATTADHAAMRGFELISVANQQTVDGLVDSLAAALTPNRKGAAA